MAQLRGNSTVGGQPILHLGNLKQYLRNFSTSLADEISFSRAGFTSSTVSAALGELTPLTRTVATGDGLTGGGNLTANRTIAVNFGGTGSATTVARSDHSHTLTSITDVTLTSPASGHILQHDGTKWVNRTLASASVVSTGTAVNTGSGLSGGGDLSTSRTLSVSFGGTGSATTVSRSDHNHDSTYVNLSSGTKQVVTSNVDLNGAVTVNGSLSSPIAQATVNSGTSPIGSYPLGFSFAGTGTSTGMPSTNGMLVSFHEAAHRNFQLFHSKNTNKLFVRSHSDATNNWLSFSGIALDEDVIAVANRTITAGSGLTGGGNLTANRTLSVNFAGTGAATTVARSDHNHDTVYVKRSGDSMTGWLSFGSGQTSANGAPVAGTPTRGIDFSFDTDTFRLFGREDSVGELNKLVLQIGDNTTDMFVVESVDGSMATSTPTTVMEVSKLEGVSVYGELYSTSTVYENGASLFSQYIKKSGVAQTVTSPLTINELTADDLTVAGSFSSPLGATAANDGTRLLDVIPYGLSWGTTGVSNPNVIGYPAITGSVLSFQEGLYRNFQLFHEKNTHNLYLRTINDWTEDWMPFRRFAMYDELTTQSLQVAKSSKDSNGVFTVVEFRRKTDGYLIARSTLTGGTSPQYTTRVLQHFDGTAAGTLVRTDTFTLSYDSDGDLYLEV